MIASGAVDERLFAGIVREVTRNHRNSRVVLCLTTYGGVANAGYRIGKLLQSIYDDVTTFVPSICKSAGTLVACASNTISLSPFGELGPLDVQLLKKDELFERRSGLITSYALEELKRHTFDLFEHFMLEIKRGSSSISFKMASELAATVSSNIMENVYEHINVDAIGEDARNLRVASEYCQRLDRKFANLKQEAITKLVHGYPSHDFVIDSDEAGTLFERVEAPTETLYELLRDHATELVTPRSECVVTLEPGKSADENETAGEPDERAESRNEGAAQPDKAAADEPVN